MFNPFRFLKQSVAPDVLGVDIGTTSIKAVEVVAGERAPRLANYGYLANKNSVSRANTVLQASSLKLFEDDVAHLLKELVGSMKPNTDRAIASIPNFLTFSTILSFPEMNDSELNKSMAYQAKQYIPMPLTEVVLEWIKVGEVENENGVREQQILLISVPREETEKYQKIFKKAGLSLATLEVEAFSLARGLVGEDKSSTVIVDIGSRSTAFVVVEGGKLKFLGHTDFAGASITQALVSSLSINPVRAEELKRERGIGGTGPNYELSTIMIPFLDVIIEEAKRVIRSYEIQFAFAPKIERIILSGGGANLPGIDKYFRKRFELPVVKAAPFLRFEYPPAMEPMVAELDPMFSVALGLALREIS
ncbi:MAG: type IV pilus assembly protein PilM [Candidatus Liptonbacteria bacterium]